MRRNWHPAIRLTSHVSLLTLVVVGCRVSMSPVKNRVDVGTESYVAFDGDGEEGEGDLYIASASGGQAFRITFTRVHESSPALSPDGTMLAFVRGAHAADSASHRIWIMNLLNGAEREVPRLAEGAFPNKLGWSLDGAALFVRTSRGVYRVAAPPSDPAPGLVEAGAAAMADTLLEVPLGNPIAAVARDCDSGVCAFTPSGSHVLTRTGRGAFRWGADSVAWFQGETIEVRPLGGGSTRQVRWTGMPDHVRRASQFPGLGPVNQAP